MKKLITLEKTEIFIQPNESLKMQRNSMAILLFYFKALKLSQFMFILSE